MGDSILAKAFSVANDYEQAQMFNEMARALYVQCKGRFGYETQICGLTKYLNADGEALVHDLAEFIKLRKQEMK